MAKGQLHSTGTICRAEIRCPIEDEGGQHFNSVDQLIDYTATETGADAAEIRSVIASGVGTAEAISMAKDGVLSEATLGSISRASQAASLKPAQVKELDQFDPAVHSVFSNGAARTDPSVAARALKKEVEAGRWLGELIEKDEYDIEHDDDLEYIEHAKENLKERVEKQKVSEARQAAMAKEMLWIADNDASYADRLPNGAHGMLRGVQGYDHSGVSIGTVRKAPVPKME